MKIDYNELKLIKRGSVKDIYLWREGKNGEPNLLLFRFTDDSSVKDYGKLPFKIPHKGEAICAMSVENFRGLRELGANTIFIEQADKDAIIVKEVAVIDPDKNDMSKFKSNVLIPLEIIARNFVTFTSSAKRRLDDGTLHYLQLGLSEMPKSYPVLLPMAVIDGSTKLRASDEYLPWDQLCGMCKLPVSLANEMNIETRLINNYALEKGQKSGVLTFDFKVEYALDEHGNLILTDVPLAVDEITCAYVGPFNDLSEFKEKPFKIFTAGKVHDMDAKVNTSKQIIRDHYDAAEPEWVAALKEAKKAKIPKEQYPRPNPIPDKLLSLSSEMFMALANEWGGQKHFTGVRSLEAVAAEYKMWAAGFYELRK